MEFPYFYVETEYGKTNLLFLSSNTETVVYEILTNQDIDDMILEFKDLPSNIEFEVISSREATNYNGEPITELTVEYTKSGGSFSKPAFKVLFSSAKGGAGEAIHTLENRQFTASILAGQTWNLDDELDYAPFVSSSSTLNYNTSISQLTGSNNRYRATDLGQYWTTVSKYTNQGVEFTVNENTGEITIPSQSFANGGIENLRGTGQLQFYNEFSNDVKGTITYFFTQKQGSTENDFEGRITFD
jgi:hypothetical protein